MSDVDGIKLAKQAAAQAALAFIEDDMMLGIGTGSTVNYFIDALVASRIQLAGVIATSSITAGLLKQARLPIVDLNSAGDIALYVDGADEIDPVGACLKGGGGALTQEKIVATVAQQWLCIVDHTKCVNHLGAFPLAIEVLDMARSSVARALVKLGMDPVYREGFVTDNGHVIIDAYGMPQQDIINLEHTLNQLPGVVCHGLFATRAANKSLVGQANGEVVLQSF